MNDLSSWPVEASGADRPAESFGIVPARDDGLCPYWDDGRHEFVPQPGAKPARCGCGKEWTFEVIPDGR